MKLVTKITLGLATASLLLVGCNGANTTANNSEKAAANKTAVKEVVKPVLDETKLGYRGADLLKEDDVVPPKVEYTDAPPGTSKRFKRAYQDAPPMIPHSVEGLLPITKDNNQCLGCHMPDVAKSMGATPIPVSHFTNFRPKTMVKGDKVLKNGKVIKNTSDENLANVSIQKENKLYPGRWNCSQCHAPQAKNSLVDKNHFQPHYTSKDGAFKSSWDESKWLKSIKIEE